MASQKVFKGGPTYLNSGGTGPDDYLIKPEKGGRWHLVKFGFGRHYKAGGPDPVQEKARMAEILRRTRLICIPEVRNVVARRGGLSAFPEVNGQGFIERHGTLCGKEDVRCG
jgi:hypothetical protein